MSKFKEFAKKYVKVKSKSILEEAIKNVKEPNHNESLEIEEHTDENSDIKSDNSLGLNHLGSFNYIPNPLEVPKNTTYRNINEGVVYIKKEQLWEEFVRDGKNGQTPKSWPSGGGLGEKDVRKIVNDSLGNIGGQGVINAVYTYSHPEIVLLSGISATTLSATSSNLVSFPVGYIPKIIGLEVYGPAQSASYVVSANLYTSNDGINLSLLATSTISNVNNADAAIIVNMNNNKYFASDLILSSGVLTSGVSVKVVS